MKVLAIALAFCLLASVAYGAEDETTEATTEGGESTTSSDELYSKVGCYEYYRKKVSIGIGFTYTTYMKVADGEECLVGFLKGTCKANHVPVCVAN